MLVAFDSVCASGLCIPSKLYHYAQCHGALLPIGRTDGSMAEEASKIGVRTWAPTDIDGIVGFLHGARSRWASGAMNTPSDRHGVLEFEHRADEMASLFERGAVGCDPSDGRRRTMSATAAAPSARPVPIDPRTREFVTHFLVAYPRRTAAMVLALGVSALADGLGVLTLLPVLELAIGRDGGAAALSPVSMRLAAWMARLSIPVTLPALLGLIVAAFTLKGRCTTSRCVRSASPSRTSATTCGSSCSTR